MRFVALLLAALLLTGCAGTVPEAALPTAAPAAEPSAAVGEPPSSEPLRGFRVEGTELLDAEGQPFVIRGVNHPHSWFPQEDEIALEAMARLGCNTVRIVCGCGILYEEDTVQELIRLTDLCRELGLVAILEVHDITGQDHPDMLARAVDYWISVREALTGREEWVIVNIANEWKGQRWGREWSRGYAAQLPRLREAGIRNALLVDAPGGGQYGTALEEFGPAVLEADPEGNTFFSVHIYDTAGRDADTIRQNLSAGRDAGLCVLVGEFGPGHMGKDVDETFVLEYCHQEQIGFLGWSWKGNIPENEVLDISRAWDGSELTPWGEFLFHSEFGIVNTSEKCGIFPQSSDNS